MTKLEEEKLIKAYKIGFQDGTINALSCVLQTGIVRNNRKHNKLIINAGNFLNNQLKIFLKNKNNRNLTIKKVTLTKKEKKDMKINVKDNSKTEKIEVKNDKNVKK